MNPPQSLLVAVDFSEHSRKAIDLARSLVVGLGGRITLVTVFDVNPMVSVGELGTLAITWGKLVDDQEERLDRLLKELVADALEGVASETRVLHGASVPEAIEAAARELGVDMVVVGSQGRTGLKRVLLGSVAESIVRRSTRPVLIAR